MLSIISSLYKKDYATVKTICNISNACKHLNIGCTSLIHFWIGTVRDGGIFIEAIADFDDSEFSKCEIEIMDYVLVRYGNMTASDLFLETCKKDSLWYRAAVRTGLLETFNRQECNNSDLQINFAEVMSDSSAEVYCESLNIRQTANLLNVEFYV